MMPLWMLKDDAAEYVFTHSRLARWAPESTREMVCEAVYILAATRGEQYTRQELHKLLTAELSPGVWLVPIVVRLVLNWWFTELELERRIENFD